MGNALRDQLLKAGLVNEKQAKKAAKEKQKETFVQQTQGKSTGADANKLKAQQAQAEKIERDRQLNQQRQVQAEKKAVAAQIRQLVEQHREAKGEASDTPFNFIDRGKVKRLYVSDQVRQKIALGKLAVVRLEEAYELVPSEAAEKIRQRDAECIVVFNHPQAESSVEAKDDDPYAKFQVPDDLMW